MLKKTIKSIKEQIQLIYHIISFSFSRLFYNYGIEHAGYMAFILILCLCPALVIFLSLTHMLKVPDIGRELLYSLIYNYLSTEMTSTVKDSLQDLLKIPQQKLMTIFLLSYVWTASSFIEGIRTILNRIYRVYIPPKYLFRRMLSLIQFMLLIFVVFCLMLIILMLPKINIYLKNIVSPINIRIFKYSLLFLILFTVSSTFYKMIPNAKIRFINVVPGSILTTILWIITCRIFFKNHIYYIKANIIYGSLGNIVLTLILFYLINIIFIYGAEFNFTLTSISKVKKF